MKSIILVFSLWSVAALCQVAPEKSGTIKVAKGKAFVAASKMKVFYHALDNPITVSVPGVSQSQILVKCSSNATVQEDLESETYTHVVKVKDWNPTTIYVYRKTGGMKETLVDSTTFRVKPIPTAFAMVQGRTNSDVITQKELKEANALHLMLPNFEFDLRLPITSFEVLIMSNGSEQKYITSGSAFSDEMKRAFTKVQKGNRIIVHNVMGTYPDNEKVMHSPLILTIQ